MDGTPPSDTGPTLLNSLPVRPSAFPPGDNQATNLKPQLWASATRPYPTNSWWCNMCLEDGKFPVFAAPYTIKALPDEGLSVGYPWPVEVQPTYMVAPQVYPWTVGAVEGVTGRAIERYDVATITLSWKQNKKGATGSMQAAIAQGSPFITTIYSALTPRLTTPHAIITPPAGPITGSKFTLKLNSGATWQLYFSAQVQLVVEMQGVRTAAPFTGTLRLALVPKPEVLPVLDANSDLYPVSTTFVASSSGDSGTYGFNWGVVSMSGGAGKGKLLMLAQPHQMDAKLADSVQVQPALQGAYQQMKGPYTGVLGDRWRLKEKLPPLDWRAPRAIPATKVEALKAILAKEQGIQVTARDPYFGSSQCAAVGQQALIADDLGQVDIAKKLRSQLQTILDSSFLNAGAGPTVSTFLYDTKMGGVVSKEGLKNGGADFGQGIYNDHHFHFGYLLYAVAALGAKDPNWLSSKAPMVIDLVKDIANPTTNDTFFPFARYMDFYSGHSWASGLWGVWDVKNQESVSEAVHAYYAVALIGQLLKNNELSTWGRLMMAIEIRAAKKYWQIQQATTPYPKPFADNKVVGILWATKIEYSTFFGNKPEFIHCIQHIPVRAHSEQLLSPAWIKETWPILNAALQRTQDPITPGFKTFVLMAMAIIDPEAAWKLLQDHTWDWNGPHAAVTKTSALWWAATRPAV